MKASKKIDNHEASRADKVDLRRRVLDAVGGRVLDCYAGTGQMFKEVWCRAAGGYEGIDIRYLPDEREAFVADNKRVLRNIDLTPFSIFDIDAYGSPWEVVIIICARRKVAPGERVGICITEGSGLKLKFGKLPRAMAKLSNATETLQGAGRSGKELAARAIIAMARRMNARVEHIWRAERSGVAPLIYFGVVLVGE
jgi:hypothetical protein